MINAAQIKMIQITANVEKTILPARVVGEEVRAMIESMKLWLCHVQEMYQEFDRVDQGLANTLSKFRRICG